MTKKKWYVSLSFFLLINILFIQAGLEFFHSEECHRLENSSAETGLAIHDDSQDCAVCSLELFNELFFVETHPLIFFLSFEDSYSNLFNFADFTFSDAASGRAPPLS